jgi:EAL domain-containing protein (putative c-di-GMP-specific phosphodiesterase class I)
VAEGIERVEQLEFLKNAECDMYQGYYFSRAISAADFEERLRNMFGGKG